VATRSVSNGLLAGTPLRWRRLSKSSMVSAKQQDGRRANHERGRTSGERASGSVTVSTSPRGKGFEGHGVCGNGRDSAETSPVGLKPDEPYSR
jgi:hypothetical protein